MKGAFNPGAEFRQPDGFGAEVCGAGFDSVKPRDFSNDGGEQQYWNAPGRGLLPQGFADGESVEVGQHQVEDDESGQVLRSEAQCVCPVERGQYVIAVVFKVVAEEFNHVGCIVHHENCRAHADTLPSKCSGKRSATLQVGKTTRAINRGSLRAFECRREIPRRR